MVVRKPFHAKRRQVDKLGDGRQAFGIATDWPPRKLASMTGAAGDVASPDAP